MFFAARAHADKTKERKKNAFYRRLSGQQCDKPNPVTLLPHPPTGSVFTSLAQDGHCLLLRAGVSQVMTGQSVSSRWDGT